MLDELKRLNYPGRKDDLVYFLQHIIGNNSISLEDIRVLCSHAPAGYQLRADCLIAYCSYFGWLEQDEVISLHKDISYVLDNSIKLNRYMIESSLRILFSNKILTAAMFVYDIDRSRVLFRNELLSLSYANVRNVLVSQEFLIVERDEYRTIFKVNSDFEKELAQLCKNSSNSMTLEKLKSKLEADSITGAKAEAFVLEYEKRRIKNPILQNKIKQISEVDVCAGYDILSYENDESTIYDRFIEVKAVSRNLSFFWSRNEFEIAKLRGEKYYLYLVNLSRINDEDYAPVMIQDPAVSVMCSSDWCVESESYYIQKI